MYACQFSPAGDALALTGGPPTNIGGVKGWVVPLTSVEEEEDENEDPGNEEPKSAIESVLG